MASDLPLAFKWLYLLTNAPFFYVGYATLRWAAPAAPPEGPAACPWAVLALGRITGHADFSCP